MRFNSQNGSESQPRGTENGQQETAQPTREQLVAEQMAISLQLAQAEAAGRFVGLFNKR